MKFDFFPSSSFEIEMKQFVTFFRFISKDSVVRLQRPNRGAKQIDLFSRFSRSNQIKELMIHRRFSSFRVSLQNAFVASSGRKSSSDFHVNECLHQSRLGTLLSGKHQTSAENTAFAPVEKSAVRRHRPISESLCRIRREIFSREPN